MPLIDGGEADREHSPRAGGAPMGRVANTTKLLMTAAVIMSGMLILSSFVTTLLIAPADYREGGKASGRAIAFLGAPLSWPRLRHSLRHVDDPHPRSRRRVGDGRPAPPDPPLPSALRDGPALGCAIAAAGPRAVRNRRHHHADLSRVSGSAERRLRYGCPCADSVGRLRGHTCALARASLGSGFLHGLPPARVCLHAGGQLPGTPGRIDHRHCFYAASDSDVRPQPIDTFGGISHSRRLFHRCRELAHRAGVEGQEGPAGSHC